MFYKNCIIISIILSFTNCTTANFKVNQLNMSSDNNFVNRGFALIYSEDLFNKKIISNIVDEQTLIIFQKYLKKNTQVKITNILNNKSLIAIVGKKSDYPSFNNSVISRRIADELNININEPYVEILEIPKNSVFIAKKAKTFDEEKNVANKAPVNNISINDLNEAKKKKIEKTIKKFSYIIKIGDFYFNDTAYLMIERIKVETKIKKASVKMISGKKYRVYLGPFNNINSLQNSYYDIDMLDFENIEIIKND